MAKSSLDTGHALYANLIEAFGYDGTNWKAFVANANHTLLAGATTGSDSNGSFVENDGSAGNLVEFGTADYLSAESNWSIVLILGGYVSTDNAAGTTVRLLQKTDQVDMTWLTSENVGNAFEYNVGGDSVSFTVSDGLRGGVNTDPRELTMLTWSRDGTNFNARYINYVGSSVTNETTGSAAHSGNNAFAGSGLWRALNDWDGKLYAILFYDKALSTAEQDTLIANHEAVWGASLPFAIDTPPASLTRGSTFQMVVSNPATAPTTGNSSFTLDPGGLAVSISVDSVTGTGPYTLNGTINSNIAIQHGTYDLRVTVDAETADASSIALNEPAGWDYVNLSSPGSIGGYTAKTPATGDQLVYATSSTPDALTPTFGADGEISSWSSTPTATQTFDIYLIAANGTIYATETYTYNVVPISADSVDNATPQVGDQVTITFSSAKAAVSLSIPAGALTIDSQTSTTATFTVPDPKTFGTKVTGYMEDTTITVDDGTDTDTITIDIQPEDSHYYAVISEVAGIYADDTGLVVGDQAYGYFLFGGGDVDLATGSIAPSENSAFRYWLRDATDNVWGNSADENITFIDTTPDAFTLDDYPDAEPSENIVRSFTLTGITSGETVTVTATGSASVSSGATYGATATAQLNDVIYVRVPASATYGDTATGGCTIGGVSDSFTVTTRDAVAPTITTQPSADPVEVGESVTLSVVASNAASYQWYKNGSALSGQTGSTYTFSATLDDDAATYYVIVTSSEGGTTQSNTVTLSVADNTAPTITGSATHTVNEGAAFSANYTIANRDGNAPTLSGADSSLFSIVNSSGDVYALTMTAKDYESPLDADTNNAYEVTINIDDGINPAVTLAVTVTVADITETFWAYTPPSNRILRFT